MPNHLDRRALLTEAALMLLPALVFALLAAYHLTLPGLYYDEAADAVPAMYLLQHVQPEMARPHGIPFGGLTLPLMVFDYVGSVSTYAVLPFFAALGPGVMALRLMCIAGGAATVAASAFETAAYAASSG